MFFESIEELKKVVRLNGAAPFETLQPYIDDAAEMYIEPHVGLAILKKTETDAELKNLVQRALGPMSVYLATDEFAVLFGDAGLTVTNEQGKRSPASDAKISLMKQNLYRRGMAGIDRLVAYLEKNASKYSEYTEHVKDRYPNNCLIRSPHEFQDKGCVDICYSATTYRTMLPALMQVQQTELDSALPGNLLDNIIEHRGEAEYKKITLLCIQFLANRVSGIYISRTSHAERQNKGQAEYEPLIRPLFLDFSNDENFFARQADEYLDRIQHYIQQHGEEIGVTIDTAEHQYVTEKKKIFNASL